MMKFHPDKCKTLAVSNSQGLDPDFLYGMEGKVLSYTELEKDLGVHVNGKLNWTQHCEILYSRASQKLGLLRRTCSFVKNRCKRRSLYITIVGSQFEHCSIVYRPSALSTLDKLESLQKKGFKYIIDDAHISLRTVGKYYSLCKKLNILPMSFKFDLRDLTFFHAILYEYSVTKLPDYLTRFSGSRLRRSHYDSLSIVSSIIPRIPINLHTENSNLGISKSYFYRAHITWNKLPISIREIDTASKFKAEVLKYLWSKVSDIIKCEFEADNF